MSWFKSLFGGGSQNPEEMYKQAVQLFGQNKFHDAVKLLEETARLNPGSAPVQFTLGATYSRIGAERPHDEDHARRWMLKSRDAFQKCLDLAPRSGGLNEKQLTTAREAVIAFDRVAAIGSPTRPEGERKRIFADFMETHDTEFLLGTNIAQEFNQAAGGDPGAGLVAMMQSLNRNAAQADAATYAKIGGKYHVSEGELRAIVDEGKQKKWPFRGVTR